MAYFIGVFLALAVAAFAGLVGFDRDRAFYPTVMVVIAWLYGLFAAIGGSMSALAGESIGIVGFTIAAVAGFKRSLWIVVGALAAHGIYDFFHGHLFLNPGVPVWWPQFCLAYDVVAALCLAGILLKRKNTP